MVIGISLSSGILYSGKFEFGISSKVKRVCDNSRKCHDVALTFPDKKPFDPQGFPKGLWNITGLTWQQKGDLKFRTYGEVRILTDAWQWVDIWELDENGDYLRSTEEKVRDSGYSLYYSVYSSVLRGIKFNDQNDALLIAKVIQNSFLKKEKVQIEIY